MQGLNGYLDAEIAGAHEEIEAKKRKKEKKPDIVVVVEGGVIQNIIKRGTARKLMIEIRDFDVQGDEDPDVLKKVNGEEYIQSIW